MHKTMVALIAVSIAAALLGYGCRDKAATQAEVTPLADTTAVAVPVADASMVASAPVACTPDTSGPGAGGSPMYAELANPQSDDQGNYVPRPRDENYSVLGYVSGKRPVAQIMVNDVEADTFAADYRPYGAPADYSPIGFRVPVMLGPNALVTVSMIDADGYRETMIFHPDRERAHNRVHELWQVSQDEPYANLRMANTFAVEGDYRDAYVRYHRAIGLNAGFMWGPFFLGVTLYDNDRYDDAEWQFRHCRRMDSGFYLANYEVGRCYERRGNYSAAILEYQVVIGARPQFVQARWSLGEVYAQQGNWSGATIQYRQALQYNPRFAPAHRGLGESLAHQGQWAASATSLRMAANINPRDARTRDDLSSTMKHQQRSPQQYRIAMAPMSAPRGSEQVPAQNMRYTKSGQAYQAVGGQENRPSGRHQIQPSAAPAARVSGGHQAQAIEKPAARASGGHQAQPTEKPAARASGGHRAQPTEKPAVRGHQGQPSATPTANPASRQHQAQPSAKPAAKPQSQPSRGHTGKPSGDQTDQNEKGKGH